MTGTLPLWIEILVAILLVTSGLFALGAAVGILRLDSFFQRMHPPALAFSMASWCVALASIIYFTAQDGELALHAWLIPIFLALTIPITTILLARTELFRRRLGARGTGDVPASLRHQVGGQPPPGAGAGKP